jgi:hypothetical protein
MDASLAFGQRLPRTRKQQVSRIFGPIIPSVFYAETSPASAKLI